MIKNKLNEIVSHKTKLLVLILAILSLSACEKTESETSANDSASTEKVEQITSESSNLIAEANKQSAKAKEVGFEWSTTQKLIDQAQQAEEAGDTKLASELANKAIKESKNSLAQAKYADEHWQDHTIN
ncbi:MAG: hypothetical protein COA86_13300 [Kangiella sp.]|nr:MAG: hypothetical protein COA86_13300 [Kangiella sp.]